MGCTHEKPKKFSYPFCPACMRSLLQRGLCKWCGKKPRVALTSGPKKFSDYCVGCAEDAGAKARDLERGRTGGSTQHRDQDAREVTRETKFGLDR